MNLISKKKNPLSRNEFKMIIIILFLLLSVIMFGFFYHIKVVKPYEEQIKQLQIELDYYSSEPFLK